MRLLAKSIITHDGKAILAYSLKDGVTSYFGGGIENLETAETSLIRELGEELNIPSEDISKIKVIGMVENFFLYDDKKAHHFAIYHHVELKSIKNVKIMEQEKHELRFVDINKLKDIETKPRIQNEIQEYFDTGINFHEIVNEDDIAI